MNQIESLDLAIKPVWMNQIESLDLAIKPVWIKHLNALDSAINSKSLKKYEDLQSLYTEQELSEISATLAEVSSNLGQRGVSEEEVEKAFQKLPCLFLLLLRYLFNYILMPLFVGVCLQPLLVKYTQNNHESRRVQTSAIKKLPQLNGVNTTALNRFISGDRVRLRASASIKSEVISSLDFGQIVYILEKDRSWVKVSVPLKGGDSIEGWVFNEYTERFRN
ncbi:hypothetical protein VCRA2113O356_200001 [Vibrio crassostreae]|nr:hypothetical protein VCRA2113O356_200001 [Vibrio crassostreae]